MKSKKLRTLVALTAVSCMIFSNTAMATENIAETTNTDIQYSNDVQTIEENKETTSTEEVNDKNANELGKGEDSIYTDETTVPTKNDSEASKENTDASQILEKPEGSGEGTMPSEGQQPVSSDGSITNDPILSGMLSGGPDGPGGPGGMGPGGDMGPGDGDMPMGQGGNHGSDVKVEAPDNTVPEGYTINSETQADASLGLYEKLFDDENLVDVNINVSDDNWNYLLQNGADKPYVLASSFSIGDETIENVGLKTKGNSSLSSIWSSDSDRYSFAISTDKYIKAKKYGENQNFYGATKIALNNIMTDSTMLKEYLSYKLMKEMGVPTPLCSLVKLNVNGEYWGLYCMVEMSNESMAERLFTSSDGQMFKPETKGGNLVYNSNLDNCLNEDGSYNFDISTYGESSNPLTSYSGLLENKEFGSTVTDYKKEEDVQKDLNELFTWMKKLNELNTDEDPNTQEYKDSMEEILDVDEVLRYFATNTYLVSMDSYQGNFYHNYIMYLDNGKVSVIPWDYNMSFGGFGMNDISSVINFNIDAPVQSGTLEERPLLNALLKNSEYRAKYEQYLKDCTSIVSGGTVEGIEYESDNFNNIIDEYKEKLADAVKDDPTAFYTYDEFVKGCDTLKKLNNKRNDAVLNQINDDFTKVDDDGINLSDLGSMMGGGPGGPGGPGGDGGPGHGEIGKPGMNSTGLSMEVADNSEKASLNETFTITVSDDKEYDLSKLRVRYYYTKDNESDENCICDYSGITYSEAPWYEDFTSNVEISSYDADTKVENIDSYYEVKFNSNSVLKSGSKLTVNARINKADWSEYNTDNDFSNITGAALYYEGQLVGIYKAK